MGLGRDTSLVLSLKAASPKLILCSSSTLGSSRGPVPPRRRVQPQPFVSPEVGAARLTGNEAKSILIGFLAGGPAERSCVGGAVGWTKGPLCLLAQPGPDPVCLQRLFLVLVSLLSCSVPGKNQPRVSMGRPGGGGGGGGGAAFRARKQDQRDAHHQHHEQNLWH